VEKKLFLTLAGNIGCGKTTAAKLISQQFGYELFDEPVIDNRFLKDYYADMKRWSFTLQMEFLIRRVEHHELIKTVPKSCVQDRSLYEDPEIFAVITNEFLEGLGGYYISFPQVCRKKYGVEVITFNASTTDIRSEKGRDEFLAEVQKRLS